MPEPRHIIVRLPDPDEYPPDSLMWQMATRLRELDGIERERGRSLLQVLTDQYDAAEAWLDDVGRPQPKAIDRDWDDETDWHKARW